VTGAERGRVKTISRPEVGARFSGSELVELLRDARASALAGRPAETLDALRGKVARKRAIRYLDVIGGPEILTLAQAAFILCRSKAYVRQLIIAGRLAGEFVPAELSGEAQGHWRIAALDVSNFAHRSVSSCSLC
jgi:hypothetical protein